MTLRDDQLIDVLNQTVAIIDPVLDVLATADPLELKARTHDESAPSDSICDKASGAAAWTLDAADWPGTAGWSELSMNDRADWWVSRVGGVTTTAVAFPGLFGVWARAIPLGHYLGYASQALVLRAVAREYGVTTRASGIALLAQILFGRDVSATLNGLDPAVGEPDLDEDVAAEVTSGRTSLLSALWRVGRTLYELSKSLDSRPAMPKLLRWGSMLPVVGGPVTYLGERVALQRAVAQARKWIVAHPAAVEPSKRATSE